jgi:hypothetical protein
MGKVSMMEATASRGVGKLAVSRARSAAVCRAPGAIFLGWQVEVEEGG